MTDPLSRGLRRWRLLTWSLVLLCVVLAAAVVLLWRRLPPRPPPAIVEAPPELRLVPAAFDELPGWSEDPLDGFSEAFARSCGVLGAGSAARPVGVEAVAGQASDWRVVCEAIQGVETGAGLRRVLERHLRPWSVRDRGETVGLFTGYFEPLLHGSRQRTSRFRVPLYRRPPELVSVDLGAFREDLRGRRLAGQVDGSRLVPYADRRELEEGALAGRGLELLWVDDPIGAFFLHIQGSGRIELEDGTHVRVGYAGQNGHPYYAIGRELVQRGALTLEQVSMQSIQRWLETHPEEAVDVMRLNASYVFFRELAEEGPIGSQGVPLTPLRSMAVDPGFLPMGAPLWLDATAPAPDPHQPDRVLRRMLVAQDTGGAIRGPLRGDVFWGHGPEAGAVAGRMRHAGRLWLLLPRSLMPAVSRRSSVFGPKS